MKGMLADSHIHTEYSHDSRCPLEEHCAAAVERGISVITVTDHCDVLFCRNESNCDNIKASAEKARRMNEKMGEALQVIAGVELGDGELNQRLARLVADTFGLDAVLGSVHNMTYKHYGISFSALNFSGWDRRELDGFMAEYFDEAAEMLDAFEMDVLAHLTSPLKYINGRYNLGYTLEGQYERIEKIFKTIIERGIALEVNTSAFAFSGETIPDKRLLGMYKELGGELITLASDAHASGLVGTNFDRAISRLREIGFGKYYYIKNRTPVPVEFPLK